MTEIFIRWLQTVDADMATQDRRIAMLYDFCLLEVEPEDHIQFKNVTMIRVNLLLDKLVKLMEFGIATALKI